MTTLSTRLKKIFWDTFFPQFCLNCHREGEIFCRDCLSTIGISEYQFCPFCSVPKRVMESGKCSQHKNKKLDGLISATSYQEPLVKKMIINFKYKPYLKTLAKPLADLIITHFISSGNKKILSAQNNSLLIPIPLYRNREKERGFNQSALIAQELAQFFQIPFDSQTLLKTKKTPHQMELNREQRQENIRGVFAVKNTLTVREKIIFLVDDVFTTGSTMEEAAGTLKTADAKEVWGIVVAREPLQSWD